MFCPHCGSRIDDGAHFCPNCGHPVSAPLWQGGPSSAGVEPASPSGGETSQVFPEPTAPAVAPEGQRVQTAAEIVATAPAPKSRTSDAPSAGDEWPAQAAPMPGPLPVPVPGPVPAPASPSVRGSADGRKKKPMGWLWLLLVLVALVAGLAVWGMAERQAAVDAGIVDQEGTPTFDVLMSQDGEQLVQTLSDAGWTWDDDRLLYSSRDGGSYLYVMGPDDHEYTLGEISDLAANGGDEPAVLCLALDGGDYYTPRGVITSLAGDERPEVADAQDAELRAAALVTAGGATDVTYGWWDHDNGVIRVYLFNDAACRVGMAADYTGAEGDSVETVWAYLQGALPEESASADGSGSEDGGTSGGGSSSSSGATGSGGSDGGTGDDGWTGPFQPISDADNVYRSV